MLDKRKGKSSKQVLGEVLDNDGVQSIENENWRELVDAHTTNLRAKKVEAQVDYSYNDHVMDNFSLRKFNPADGMSMPMASNVARRTLNARVAMTQDWGKLQLISGIDSQKNEHTKRSGSLMSPYQNKARVGVRYKSVTFALIGVMILVFLSYELNVHRGKNAKNVRVVAILADKH